MQLELKFVVGISNSTSARFRHAFAVVLELGYDSLKSFYLLSFVGSADVSSVKSLFFFEFFELEPHFPGISNFLHSLFHNCFQFNDHLLLFFDGFLIDIDSFVFFGHSVNPIIQDLNVVFLGRNH